MQLLHYAIQFLQRLGVIDHNIRQCQPVLTLHLGRHDAFNLGLIVVVARHGAFQLGFFRYIHHYHKHIYNYHKYVYDYYEHEHNHVAMGLRDGGHSALINHRGWEMSELPLEIQKQLIEMEISRTKQEEYSLGIRHKVQTKLGNKQAQEAMEKSMEDCLRALDVLNAELEKVEADIEKEAGK